MARLLDEDPVLGIRRFFHWNDADKTFTIETRQQVGAIVEANKRQFNDADKRYGKGFMHHIGRVPLNIAMQYWLTRDPDQIKTFLNLSDNRAWKTKPVRV